MRATSVGTLILCLIVIFSASALAAPEAAFSDIENNWARQAIASLQKIGLFEDLWEGEFLPHSPVSRRDAVELIARAFQLTRAEQDRLALWLQETFASELEEVTRGEFAAAAANPLALGELTEPGSRWYPDFIDLSPGQPEFLAAETLYRLGVLPAHMSRRFESYRPITRSEAAFIIHEALTLERAAGLVAEIGEGGQILIERDAEQGNLQVQIREETLYLTPRGLAANGSELLQLEKGRKITALVKGGQALLIGLNKDSTAQVLLQGLNSAAEALADILTPAQLSAIVSGDWEQLNEEIRYELYEELVRRGAAPWEADALLKQDWDNLQFMAQERITQEAAEYLQVPPELIHAVLARDWQKVLDYAQTELMERLLAENWLKVVPKN